MRVARIVKDIANIKKKMALLHIVLFMKDDLISDHSPFLQ